MLSLSFDGVARKEVRSDEESEEGVRGSSLHKWD